MAKRKTIRFNPLDTLVPNSTTPLTGESPAETKAQSADPAAGSTRTTAARKQPKTKDNHLPTLATRLHSRPLLPIW